ncbi:MAG: hypothetical protein LCH76_13465 [Actinobacteria bacterium]|nr:hypothetical protein [Actinomycetota bacterium]
MSGFFAARGGVGDPWFRLGRLEVGTVMAVVLAVAVSWLAYVILPPLPGLLAFVPEYAAAGEVWRLVTWPLANGLSLWSVIALFFFWYFGTDLEQALGRRTMAWLLVGIWASLTAAATIVGLVLGAGYLLAGINVIEFAILLLWIAEYPDRRFLFNIPAWVFGLVLVGLQVLQAVAARDLGSLLSLALALALIAIAARYAGLLSAYRWIPGGRRQSQPRQRRRSRGTAFKQAGRTDRERLDELLDQINEQGIGSLTDAQRKELMRLRERLRRG